MSGRLAFCLNIKPLLRRVLVAKYRSLHHTGPNLSPANKVVETSTERNELNHDMLSETQSKVPKVLSDVTGQSPQAKPPEPPDPGVCCMTACANCVWIRHVEELIEFYHDKGKDAAREALEKVPDENLKAFLKIELDLGK